MTERHLLVNIFGVSSFVNLHKAMLRHRDLKFTIYDRTGKKLLIEGTHFLSFFTLPSEFLLVIHGLDHSENIFCWEIENYIKKYM